MKTNLTFNFDGVVFFGRHINEYVDMCNLDLQDMKGMHVLDCCAGPAAFAAQAQQYGIEVTACDPMYGRDLRELRNVVDTHADLVRTKQETTWSLFHPEVISVTERRSAMEVFLDDYENGWKSGRYVQAALPHLPFADQEFDMVLCNNLLFLYSDQSVGGMMVDSRFDYQFHLESLKELLRVTRSEVRIYPLQGPKTVEHEWLRPLMNDLRNLGYRYELQPVRQRDIIGAEQMLLLSR